MIELEVCINCDGNQSVGDAVKAAYQGGASRIELCGAMNVDGLTPQKSQILEARKAFKERVGLLVMIRPRALNFNYSADEIAKMCDQIVMAADAGANGVVLGTLKAEDDSIDTESLKKLLEVCSKYKLQTTFHRAFDAVANPIEQLELLIDHEVDRILTSGIPWGEKGSATEGIFRLKRIVEKSENKIEIVIGGGVNNKNIEFILSHLPYKRNNISLHSFSGAQEKGKTTAGAVGKLFNIIKNSAH